MPKPIRYKTKTEIPQKGWMFAYIPNYLVGTSKRVWIKGTLNGHPIYFTANPWRDNQHIVTINREFRTQAGIEEKEQQVILEFEVVDRPPPEKPIDKDILNLLKKHPKALAKFERIPPSHRKEYKEYIEYIKQAKKPETRTRRIEQSIERLIKTAK